MKELDLYAGVERPPEPAGDWTAELMADSFFDFDERRRDLAPREPRAAPEPVLPGI